MRANSVGFWIGFLCDLQETDLMCTLHNIFVIIERCKLTVLQNGNTICYWPSITLKICHSKNEPETVNALRAVVISFYNYCLEFACHSIHSTDFIFIMKNLHLRNYKLLSFPISDGFFGLLSYAIRVHLWKMEYALLHNIIWLDARFHCEAPKIQECLPQCTLSCHISLFACVKMAVDYKINI